MEQVDYRFTDQWADPVGTTEHLHTEELVRLPGGFLCYQPPLNAPDIQAPPFLRNGYITFGSFNNFIKIHPGQLKIWAEILLRIPNSRLVIKTPLHLGARAQARVRSTFCDRNISEDRVSFLPPLPQESFLSVYAAADIALDPFPYNGTTTTCESLLTDLIADNVDGYVEIATKLAQEPEKLASFRESIRFWMAISSLCDPERLTSEIEDAYRAIYSRSRASRT
jgi:predicted O-linked N-acetylglucosamine transferase (SPINDLY family)